MELADIIRLGRPVLNELYRRHSTEYGHGYLAALDDVLDLLDAERTPEEQMADWVSSLVADFEYGPLKEDPAETTPED